MIRKLLTVMLIGGTLAVAACNTVRGAGEDVNSVANAAENAINWSRAMVVRPCYREE